MYDQAPSFGFPGSTIGSLPSTLDNINPGYYDQISRFVADKGGRLASVCGLVLYDTLRIDAGIMPTRDFNFFSNGLGAQQSLYVTTATTYTKQEIDVSPWVNRAGELSSGYEALVWSIGVIVQSVGAIDESIQTAGNAVGLTLDPGIISGEAAGDAVKQGNVLRAFREGLYFELFLNNTTFENGPLWRFPCGPYGVDGGIALGGVVAAPIGDGVLNNGLGGYCYSMPVMRHIPSQTKFGVRLKTQNPFTLASNIPVRVNVFMEGIGVQPVTG